MGYIISILIFVIGFLYANSLTEKHKDGTYTNLFFYHFIFTNVYFWFVSRSSADANMYYKVAMLYEMNFAPIGTGNDFLHFINVPLVQIFEFNKYAIFCFYGFLSFYGFIFYYKILKKITLRITTIYGVKIVTILLFLPGMHFWTAGLGKDCIIFTSVVLIFYSFLDKWEYNKLHIFLSVMCIVCIRPHVMIILLLGFISVYAFNSVTTFNFKSIFIVLGLLGVLVALFPLFEGFVSLSDTSVDGVNQQLDRFNRYGKEGLKGTTAIDGSGSSLDISSYPLPYKMFSFLFRPFFYDARSIIQLIASVENVILFSIFINFFMKVNVFKFYGKLNNLFRGMFWYVVIGMLVFGLTVYNLGLASRQKFMIVPELVLLLVIIPDSSKKQKRK